MIDYLFYADMFVVFRDCIQDCTEQKSLRIFSLLQRLILTVLMTLGQSFRNFATNISGGFWDNLLYSLISLVISHSHENLQISR